MPGNGIGDRVHNSFGHENLSQGQHHFKAVDKNWPGLTNNIWVGSQTQNGVPLIPNPKNYSVPQSANIDNGHGIQYFQAVNGLNAAQLNLRSEVAGSQFQNQQTALNGFMQEHTAPKQYEANFLGVDADSYQNTVTSKGLPFIESHHGNGTDLQKKDFGRFPDVQPPVSFNSFGGQEHMGSQHTGVLQSWQRQQSGISDMQLLQQQMILRQLQDNQRQPFQQQGFWQQNSPMNLLSSMGNQAAANHSTAFLNGIPVHDSSDKPWPEPLASNPDRQQHLGTSAIMQGSSSGFEVSSEQSQTLCSTGLALQQCDQSLYGVPIPGIKNNMSKTFQMQSENSGVQQISSFGNSFSRSQHAAPSDHDNKHGSLVSRQVGSPAGHNSISGFESSNSQQLIPSQGNVPMQEFPGKLELAGSSDPAQEKTSSATVHSQNMATLDPTEEKILFGSDDNLWEAFGGEMNTGLGGFNMSEGSGLFGGVPSLQSGSWSALMQSALAENSSVETGQQEEWSGLSFRSTEPTTGHGQLATFDDGVKQEQQSARGESSVQAGSSFLGAFGHQLDRRASHERTENLHSDSSPRYIQESSAGSKNSESSLLARLSNECIPICGKADNSSLADRTQHSSGPWTHQQSISSYDAHAQLNNRATGWNAISSRDIGEGSNLKSPSSDMALQSSKSSSHNRLAHEFHGATAGKTDIIHGLAVGNDQLKSLGGTMLQRQDSSTSNIALNSGSSKAFQESTHWLQNNQSFNFWRQVDSSSNSRGSDVGGKSHYLGEGSKFSESSGNNDVLERQNSSTRENSNSFPSNVSHHASPGLVQNAYIDGSDSHNLHGHKDNSSGRAVQKPAGVPKFQYHPMGDLGADIDSSQSKGGAYPPAATQQVSNKLFPLGGSGGSLSMKKSAQPSQNMLELLHKLDQSKEREAASHFSSSDRNDAHEAETSDGSVGQLHRNQSPGSGSRGFGLQLAPPSQQLQNLDRVVHFQGSSPAPNSQGSLHGKVSSVNHVSDASLPRSVSNSISHQSFSLLHQMQAMKSAKVDLSDRTLKRFRGPDRGINSETVALGGNQLSYYGHSATSGDVQPSHPGVGIDAKVFDHSVKQGDNWDASSASLHMDALQQSGSPHSSSNSEACLRRDDPQINPPMAPSWIGHPGTLSNGQALQVLDAQRMAATKHMEQARLVQEPADNLLVHEPANQFHQDSEASPVNSAYSLPASARTENISSQNLLLTDVTDQGLLMKQKKRKIAATDVLAWHKEVTTSARLQSASATEIEWARAANRSVQKMEGETETIEDGLPSLRPKKRLILTTHLMQQLLRPPPAPFLAGDSRSHYENVTYCINKSALGDACHAIHLSSNNPSMHNSSEKILLEKPKASERSDSDNIAKAVEDIVARTKKLENELSRMDQKSSMVDLRVELQDLERFSIINRFARFHGRNQSDGSGASSSDPYSFASRPMPQRYVMALPMPRNLPDSVQCLSL